MTGPPARETNRALLGLTAVAVASGVAMYAVGSGWTAWATVAHGAAGLAMVGLGPWKATISRRSVRRRGVRPAVPALVLALATVVTLATGFAHRAGIRDLGVVLVMQLHVGAAVVVAVLTAWHVRVRPLPVRRADPDRREALRGAVLAGGAVLATAALPHAGDRPTRSLERGSFEPAAMPVTQWLDDPVARIAPDAWRLRVGERVWSLEEIEALPGREVEARLDCTGGWYATQRWAGVPLDALLAASSVGPGRSIGITSSTGYSRRFPWRDRRDLLVATRVGGQPLSPGHGAPARLVAPGRRGFWWVKWLDAVDVGDRPWWWQLPFPLD